MKRMSRRLELGEQPRERTLVLDDWTVRHVERDAHLMRKDLRERRLAEPRRAAEEHVIERLVALLRRFDEDAQILFVLLLTDVVVERARTERAVEARVFTRRLRIDLARLFVALRSRLRHR